MRIIKSISVLDCTLRDGGYCNKWEFGQESISEIVQALTDSEIEIVECGFVSNKITFNKNNTKFPSVESIDQYLPKKRTKASYVAMINCGEYDTSNIPERSEDSIDGIRIAFHKKNIDSGLEMCRQVKSKGYDVFIQGMVTIAYSDEEFIDFIKKVNDLQPYAFYIVDSFGNITSKELMRYFLLCENNLKKGIKIGFHSHNNLQLAYSNAKLLSEIQTDCDLIIDSTIYGMGRGAGNLNTELFIEYLNHSIDKKYDLKPLLNVMDDIINNFYLANPWGYSLPNYLSAINNAHPNYAGFFSDKNSLNIDSMSEIFQMMDPNKKLEFDPTYAEDIYYRYMESNKQSDEHLEDLRSLINGRTVLLIGPAMSSKTEKDKIIDYMKNDIVAVSVNHAYPYANPRFIFIGNMRRFKRLSKEKRSQCIITSNIVSDEAYARVNYRNLLNDEEMVSDNAGLMAIKLFHSLGASKIVLTGFDGYSLDSSENYADSRMMFVTKKAIVEERNRAMSKVLNAMMNSIDIEFLTKPIYYSIKKCDRDV